MGWVGSVGAERATHDGLERHDQLLAAPPQLPVPIVEPIAVELAKGSLDHHDLVDELVGRLGNGLAVLGHHATNRGISSTRSNVASRSSTVTR